MRVSVVILFLISIIASCKSKEKMATSSSAANDTILLASVERTPCFGRCATYKLSIYQSGYAVYHGKRNVKNVGYFSTRIAKEQTEQLRQYIIDNNILDLNDNYVNPHIADYPTTFTEANLNGRYKHIKETDPEAPKIVKSFAKYVDSFFNDSTQWIPLNVPEEGLK